jgi:hypothetical protein
MCTVYFVKCRRVSESVNAVSVRWFSSVSRGMSNAKCRECNAKCLVAFTFIYYLFGLCLLCLPIYALV